jgi:hypothetical protein
MTLAEVVPERDLVHSASGEYCHAASSTGSVGVHPCASRAVPTVLTIVWVVSADLKMVRTTTPLHPARPLGLSGHAGDQTASFLRESTTVDPDGTALATDDSSRRTTPPGSPPEWSDREIAKAVSPMPRRRSIPTATPTRPGRPLTCRGRLVGPRGPASPLTASLNEPTLDPPPATKAAYDSRDRSRVVPPTVGSARLG